MSAMFDVVDLDDGWTRGAREPGGDERKRWFRAPEASRYAGHWLFKPRTEKMLLLSKARRARGDSPDVLITGEDWAEKISYELAVLLDLPAAGAELASVTSLDDGDERLRGSMSEDVRPRGWSLAPGASLLAEADPSFDTRNCVGHTVPAVRGVLADAGVRGPIDTVYADWPAFDVWAGYLMFDAWTANTDRHAHNWGVLLDETSGQTCLSPSFDHGSALAAGDQEIVRASRVADGSVERWCERGQTPRFDSGVRRNLVDLAAEALSMCSADARRHWVTQITAVDLAICDDVIHQVPDMSELTRIFVSTVIKTNRKRLCDAAH